MTTLEPLPPGQWRVALLVHQGKTNPEIARTLGISPFTVRHHISAILRKWGIKHRGSLAANVQAILDRGDGNTPARDVTNQKSIILYLHCGECLKTIPKGISPQTYQMVEVGWTPIGIQVYCRRHNRNIVHIDFEGQQHPANDT